MEIYNSYFITQVKFGYNGTKNRRQIENKWEKFRFENQTNVLRSRFQLSIRLTGVRHLEVPKHLSVSEPVIKIQK